MDDELESRRRAAAVVLGEDLATFSIEELAERISACESEIARIRAIIAEKQKSQAAADTFFRT
jgi:uncharacterized small protein (DUF1192 family)